MLDRVIGWSVRHPPFVVGAWLIVAAAGAAAATRLRLDAFPDTTPVQVEVATQAPALSPEEVERQITAPVELAIAGLPGLREVRSVSKPGLSKLTVVFEDGTDLVRARQLTETAIAAAELPEGAPRPALGPLSTGLGEVLHYAVRPKGAGPHRPEQLERARTEHHFTVRPRLLSVPGVAEVNTWGGRERQVVVRPDPARLLRFGVTLQDLARALEDNNLDVGGGRVEGAGEGLLVRGRARARTLADIRAIGVASERGVAIRVSDVAAVEIGHAQRHGAATLDGGGEMVLGLGFALAGESAAEVTRDLEAALDDAARALPADLELVPLYARTDLVERVLGTVRTNLLEAALLVIAVLFAFLGHLRAGLIVAAAIPLSLLFAASLMERLGIAATLMSLGAIDFGLVVDSAVIQVENAVRRLAQAEAVAAAGVGAPREVADVVEEAALEVRKPTLFGELIIAIVYLPVLTLEGIEGKLFRPMALTVVLALSGSLLLSLTLVPALSAAVLGWRRRRAAGKRARAPRGAPAARASGSVDAPADRAGGPSRAAGASAGASSHPAASHPAADPAAADGEREPLIPRALGWLYRPVLDLALRWPKLVLLAALAALAGGGHLATRLGAEFVPRLAEGALVANTVRLAGVALEESVRYGVRIEQELLAAYPEEIERVWTRTGTAEVATDPMGVEVSDVFVTLTPRDRWRRARTQAELVEGMRARLADLPGMRVSFTQPIELRMNEIVSGIRADLGIKVFGDDLALLARIAADIDALLRTLPGAADIAVEQQTALPVLEVEVDRDALARHGVAAADALAVIGALAGEPAGEMLEGPGERRVPVVVRLPDLAATDPESLAALLVAGPGGARIPLGRLARLRRVDAPAEIQREWGRRRVAVSVNVRGRDLAGFVAEARRRIAEEIILPPGYYLSWGGQHEHLERASRRLGVVVPLALGLIALLLYATYGNGRDAARVFLGVPFAAVGGIAALHLRGLPFSVSAGVGFIALSGVSVLGDMVLVADIQRRLARGAAVLDAVRAAARTRLRPVLMTALVAALGFLPMAVSESVGAEVQRPLATVVIGGLASSTALTLLVLPVLYTWLAGARARAVDGDGAARTAAATTGDGCA